MEKRKCMVMVFVWGAIVLTGVSVWPGAISISFASEWLPKTDWRLLYTNSENTVTYDEKALNAFDGNPATHWMSRHSPSPEDPHPHEIQIDLGKSYLIDGFSYLPRQSTGANGQVKGYLFYVSEDPSNFGAHVAIGNFEAGIDEKIVTLDRSKKGRYVSFVSTSEQKVPSRYSNAAEIGVRGVAGVSGVSGAPEEFPEGDLKVIFDPSPDARATGHNLYLEKTSTGKETKTDMKKDVTHIIPKGTLDVGDTYRLTATAYGTVDGKAAESVRSNAAYVRLKVVEEPVVPEEPIGRPSAPRIVELRWEQ